MYVGLYVKCPSFLYYFKEICITSISFRKYSNIKFHEYPSSGTRAVLCGRTDRRKDRHDEAKSCFSQFCERAWKLCTVLTLCLCVVLCCVRIPGKKKQRLLPCITLTDWFSITEVYIVYCAVRTGSFERQIPFVFKGIIHFSPGFSLWTWRSFI